MRVPAKHQPGPGRGVIVDIFRPVRKNYAESATHVEGVQLFLQQRAGAGGKLLTEGKIHVVEADELHALPAALQRCDRVFQHGHARLLQPLAQHAVGPQRALVVAGHIVYRRYLHGLGCKVQRQRDVRPVRVHKVACYDDDIRRGIAQHVEKPRVPLAEFRVVQV